MSRPVNPMRVTAQIQPGTCMRPEPPQDTRHPLSDSEPDAEAPHGSAEVSSAAGDAPGSRQGRVRPGLGSGLAVLTTLSSGNTPLQLSGPFLRMNRSHGQEGGNFSSH
ncbi:hypothetical protein GCM10009681_40870 [Luedemannella helvata]|uniref:Uncharacterized protein n=1 Tax=Luedemannella helvata TaxID=349315 RepID=A0ABN2KTE5_9ACTN